MLKNSVRQRMLAQRRALSSAQAGALGTAAQMQLLQTPAYARAMSIALYAAIHGEVSTAQLHAQAAADGKAVLYPAVVGRSLLFRQVGSPQEMMLGRFGIPEPAPGALLWDAMDIDLFVVPGVAFDLNGRRIGYGKGFYDRTLHALEGSGRLFGLCFDFQLLEEIVETQHDVRMDGIVTEHRVICPCD